MSHRVAILASGAGTTAEACIRAFVAAGSELSVELVICNKPDAGIFERIANLNRELGLQIDVLVINAASHPAEVGEVVVKGGQTAAEETAILDILHERAIDLVLLLGYLRRVGPRLVTAYGWRSEYTSPYQASMLNSHPGLLPETKGLWGVHVQEHVLERGLSRSGQTLHVVAENYDEGPILAEHQVTVEPDDTAETLSARVQAVEKQNLPLDIAAFMQGRQTHLASNN